MGAGGIGDVGSSSSIRGITNRLRSFSIGGSSSKVKPFDEFNLSDDKIENMREELKQNGLCKIKVLDKTKDYLNKTISLHKDFDNELSNKILFFAQKILGHENLKLQNTGVLQLEPRGGVSITIGGIGISVLQLLF